MILIVDNRVSINTTKASLTQTLIRSLENTIIVTYTYDVDNIPWHQIDCIIFSGSNLRLSETTTHPVIHFALNILNLSVQKTLPCVGICFGCQLMCYSLGSSIQPRNNINNVIHRYHSSLANDKMYFNHYDGIYNFDCEKCITKVHQFEKFLVEFSHPTNRWIGIQWHPEKSKKGIDWLKKTISFLQNNVHK